MKRVTAGLGDQIYCATCIASSLRAGLRLRREFFNRIDRQHHTSDARNAALVDRRDVVPEVVVIHTVNLPIHLIRARPIERTEATHRVATVTRRSRDQLREIAPVQGNILHDVRSNRHVLGLRRGVQGQRRSGHFHRSGLLLER